MDLAYLLVSFGFAILTVVFFGLYLHARRTLRVTEESLEAWKDGHAVLKLELEKKSEQLKQLLHALGLAEKVGRSVSFETGTWFLHSLKQETMSFVGDPMGTTSRQSGFDKMLGHLKDLERSGWHHGVHANGV